MFFLILSFCVNTEIIVGQPTPESSTIFTESLLKDVSYTRETTEMVCTFRAYLDTRTEGIKWLKVFESYEPAELYQNNVENLQQRPPKSKFRSCCWTAVFLISGYEVPILNEKILGNTVYDQFVFISESKSMLEQALLHGQVIDKVAMKYGMFIRNLKAGKPVLGYLTEPEIYRGAFTTSEQVTVSKDFNNLNGRILTSPVFSISPILVVERDKDGNVTGFRGSHYNFTMELTKRTNFTANLYGYDLPAGERLDNGTWTGFTGEMINGFGDFCAIGGIVEDRYHLMSFTTLSYRESMVFCVKEPEPLLHWHALVFPLSKTVWIYTLSAFGAFMVVFTLIVLVRLFQSSVFSVPVFMEEGIFLPFALFLEQNIRIPVQSPARIAAISLIWLSMVIATVYKTNLVGYLTFPEKQSIPRTFKELHQHKDYTINLLTFSSLEMEILKSSPTPVFQGIVKRVNVLTNMETCLKSATMEKTACIIWKYIGTAEMMKHLASSPELKSLYFTQDTATVIDIATSLKRHSIHYKTINKYTAVTKESGLFSRWIKDQMSIERKMGSKLMAVNGIHGDKESTVNSQVDDNYDGDKGGEKALQVGNLVAVAYAFVFGCVVSFICLGVEVVITLFFYYANRVKKMLDIQ